MSKKRILRKFRITEVSTVDDPAQKPARAVIMKSRTDPDDIQKGGKLLSISNGHQHLIVTDHGEGEMTSGQTRWAKAQGDAHEHSHPWVRTASGEIVIGMVNNHTHNLDELSKGDNDMDKKQLIAAIAKYAGGDTSQAEDIKKFAKELNMENVLPAELAKAAPAPVDNSRAEAIALMTDVQKAHYKTLDAAAQSDFLKMTDDVRANEIAKANAVPDSQTIIYKADDGTTFTKADDQRLVAMAKRNDQMAKDNAELRKNSENAELKKRANELIPNLGGGDDGRAAMLKSVEAIEDDDVRKSAMESLKTANANAGTAFTRAGTSDIGKSAEALSAEDELQKMADDIAKRDNVSAADAYTKALETPRGAELYGQTVNH